MSAPIAATAERPRILRVADRPVAGPPEPAPSVDRPTSRAQRRHARRQRRLAAVVGLAVLCAFLVATVLVLDGVR